MHEFNKGLSSENYSLKCISISSINELQLESQFTILFRGIQGNESNVLLTPRLMSDQIASVIDNVSIPHVVFDGLNTLKYRVEPNTEVRLYFDLDKYNTKTEIAKMHTNYKDKTVPIVAELLDELMPTDNSKDKPMCDEMKPVEPINAFDLAPLPKPELQMPPIVCKPDPHIIEFQMKISNLSTEPKHLNLFNRVNRVYNNYKFTIPYSATYAQGTEFNITVNGVIQTYTVGVGGITREDLAIELTNMGFAKVTIKANTNNNIYNFFSRINVVSLLDFDDNAPPSIIQQPIGVTIYETQDANFSVIASGTEPLSYQWQELI
ncbi:MAG: hypothetical protein HC892_01575 [Saprospiraceae bacterium]|nr:hypothetical protein [Saprospiraceae bacterium]